MEMSIDESKEFFVHFLSKDIDLSSDQKELLLGLPIFKHYTKGSFLFQKGDRTTMYYFVIKGGIRTYKLVNGKDISLHLIIENEALIPTSTILQQPSDSYAVCFEDTILVELSEDIQDTIVQQIPVLKGPCRKFSERLLAKNQETLEKHKTLSPDQYYLQLVKERPELIQRVPQHHIATYLGIRPESLSRIRGRLNKRKGS